jgi:AraC family L-rhamnose operon regulatory protein RhaS
LSQEAQDVLKQGPCPWALSIKKRGYERETYEGADLLLPELEIFGWLRFLSALPGALHPDVHEGVYEIHYMHRGHVKWWVEDYNYDFVSGNLFIISPGEVHGGDEASMQPCEHYWLRIGFPPGMTLPGLSPEETQRLASHFASISLRNFGASPEVGRLFAQLHHEHRFAEMPHRQTFSRSLLHTLLITILRDHDTSLVSYTQPLMTWHIQRAIGLLSKRLFEADWKVEYLAEELGMSHAQLRVRFRVETGYSIHEYVVLQRIKEAKVSLKDSTRSITTIAYDLGFSSSQYFATVFRRHTGMSPGDYRSKHLASKP